MEAPGQTSLGLMAKLLSVYPVTGVGVDAGATLAVGLGAEDMVVVGEGVGNKVAEEVGASGVGVDEGAAS